MYMQHACLKTRKIPNGTAYSTKRTKTCGIWEIFKQIYSKIYSSLRNSCFSTTFWRLAKVFTFERSLMIMLNIFKLQWYVYVQTMHFLKKRLVTDTAVLKAHCAQNIFWGNKINFESVLLFYVFSLFFSSVYKLTCLWICCLYRHLSPVSHCTAM